MGCYDMLTGFKAEVKVRPALVSAVGLTAPHNYPWALCRLRCGSKKPEVAYLHYAVSYLFLISNGAVHDVWTSAIQKNFLNIVSLNDTVTKHFHPFWMDQNNVSQLLSGHYNKGIFNFKLYHVNWRVTLNMIKIQNARKLYAFQWMSQRQGHISAQN